MVRRVGFEPTMFTSWVSGLKPDVFQPISPPTHFLSLKEQIFGTLGEIQTHIIHFRRVLHYSIMLRVPILNCWVE